MMTGSLCVYCRQRPVEPDWRPFCSERCKLLDLRNWTEERYSVPGDTGSAPLTQGEGPDEGVADDRDRTPDS